MYIPRPSDIEWTRTFLSRLNDGAVWIPPMNGNRYLKDDAAKTLWLVSGEDTEFMERLDMNLQAGCPGWAARQATPEVREKWLRDSSVPHTVGYGKAIHSLAVQNAAAHGMVAYTKDEVIVSKHNYENPEQSS